MSEVKFGIGGSDCCKHNGYTGNIFAAHNEFSWRIHSTTVKCGENNILKEWFFLQKRIVWNCSNTHRHIQQNKQSIFLNRSLTRKRCYKVLFLLSLFNSSQFSLIDKSCFEFNFILIDFDHYEIFRSHLKFPLCKGISAYKISLSVNLIIRTNLIYSIRLTAEQCVGWVVLRQQQQQQQESQWTCSNVFLLQKTLLNDLLSIAMKINYFHIPTNQQLKCFLFSFFFIK